MEKQIAATVVADPLKVAEVRKQAENYKVFCLKYGLCPFDANVLALFIKQQNENIVLRSL